MAEPTTYSEITLWRSVRRFAWKPWTAEFTDDQWAYAIDGWTRRGVLQRAGALRARVAAQNGENHHG